DRAREERRAVGRGVLVGELEVVREPLGDRTRRGARADVRVLEVLAEVAGLVVLPAARLLRRGPAADATAAGLRRAVRDRFVTRVAGRRFTVAVAADERLFGIAARLAAAVHRVGGLRAVGARRARFGRALCRLRRAALEGALHLAAQRE